MLKKLLFVLIMLLAVVVSCSAGMEMDYERDAATAAVRKPVNLLDAKAPLEPVRGKLAAMTFDDGPNTTITPQLLDELAGRGVKCTFFVVGYCAQAYPEVVSRAYEEGHQIASHTYNHYTLTTQSDGTIEREIEDTRSLLEEITGESNFMVRLPYGDGANNQRVLGYMNAPVILWSVDPTNGKYPISEEQLYRGILDQVRDGSVILMHDTTSANMNAALRAIDTLQEQGYDFVTVEELFRLNGVTPQDNAVYWRVDNAGTWYDEAQLESHWAYPAISPLIELGVMQGDGTGFRPNEYMTRAMAVTLLWRAAGEPGPGAGPEELPVFLDVPADEWYSGAVAWGKETGAVYGYSDEIFGPEDPISREQFCTLLVRTAAITGASIPTDADARSYSDDGKVSAWAVTPLMNVLWRSEFVSLNEASVFRPGDSITRAEAAELISWYLTLG